MINKHAADRDDISLRVLDISPRWRAVHDTSILKRAIGGGAQLLRDFTILIWTIATWRPHVIHLTTPGQMGVLRDVVMLSVARVFGIRSIYHIRFGRVPELLSVRRGFESRLFRKAARLADHVISIDKRTHQAISTHMGPIAASMIPNCYDPAALPRPADLPDPTVVFIGWVIQTKGVEELLEAWRASALPGWKLVLIGPCDPTYKERLADKALGLNVVWFGQLSHERAMEELGRASALVLPSHTEGFPNVVLEAMALGRPVIATTVGAIPEMLADGAGVLVRPHDANGLAAALEQIQSDSIVRTTLGRNARDRAEARYSLSAVFAAYELIWRSRNYRSHSIGDN